MYDKTTDLLLLLSPFNKVSKKKPLDSHSGTHLPDAHYFKNPSTPWSKILSYSFNQYFVSFSGNAAGNILDRGIKKARWVLNSHKNLQGASKPDNTLTCQYFLPTTARVILSVFDDWGMWRKTEIKVKRSWCIIEKKCAFPQIWWNPRNVEKQPPGGVYLM